jgi:hypothetical protein
MVSPAPWSKRGRGNLKRGAQLLVVLVVRWGTVLRADASIYTGCGTDNELRLRFLSLHMHFMYSSSLHTHFTPTPPTPLSVAGRPPSPQPRKPSVARRVSGSSTSKEVTVPA